MENTKKHKLYRLTGKESLSKIILSIHSELFFVFQKKFLFTVTCTALEILRDMKNLKTE